MRAAVTVLNKYEPDANMKYSCVTFKNDNPAEGTEKTVFQSLEVTPSIFYKTMLKQVKF